jgi:hypothetical protein
MQTVMALRVEGSRPPLFAIHRAGGWGGAIAGSSATSTMISRSRTTASTQRQFDVMINSLGRSSEILRDYEPGKFDGGVLFFTAGAENGKLASGCKPYFSGVINNATVDSHHLTMTHPEILAVIGPILEDYQAGRTKLGSIQPNGGGKTPILGYLPLPQSAKFG